MAAHACSVLYAICIYQIRLNVTVTPIGSNGGREIPPMICSKLLAPVSACHSRSPAYPWHTSAHPRRLLVVPIQGALTSWPRLFGARLRSPSSRLRCRCWNLCRWIGLSKPVLAAMGCLPRRFEFTFARCPPPRTALLCSLDTVLALFFQNRPVTIHGDYQGSQNEKGFAESQTPPSPIKLALSAPASQAKK